MIICCNCFIDQEIRTIITSIGLKGSCPICGSIETYIYNTDSDSILEELFEGLFDIYTLNKNLPSEFPDNDKRLIVNELLSNWKIFNLTDESVVLKILKAICKTRDELSPDFFTSRVGIAEFCDSDYLSNHSLLRNKKWEDFVESVTRKNRFHTSLLNTDILARYCSYIQKKYAIGTIFYRGRVAEKEEGIPISEMGAPPAEKAKAGRANAEGISCLYLADDIRTTIHEVRAGAFDIITVGTFALHEDLKVINFRSIDSLSPFLDYIDPLEHAINRLHIHKIHSEMGKTLRRNDSPLDYIPTQYIIDFIKSIGNEDGKFEYNGIEYNSTMYIHGFNLAIFNPSIFTCQNIQTFSINDLQYNFDLI